MRLPKFPQRKSKIQRKSKDWSDSVDFWPMGYPHRITTYADVAAMQHLMTISGVANVLAIDHLLKNEEFWWELSHFFQEEVKKLGKMELMNSLEKSSVAVRKVPLYCWKDEEET